MSPFKKKILAVFCLIFLAFLSQPKVIHIYHDMATTPSFFQMINFINQSENDLKIVFWRRFNHHIMNKNKYKNTLFTLDQDEIFDTIRKYKEEYKRIKIILHYNLHHSFILDNLQKEFSKDIKIVHIYEDSAGYIWWNTSQDYLLNNEPKIKKNLHIWGNFNILCDKKNPLIRCSTLNEISNNIRIIPLDFYQLREFLSPEEKNELFELAGFDLEKYKKLLSKTKNAIYILGVNEYHTFEPAQLASLKDDCKKNPQYNWFYKPHPNKNQTPTQEILNHFCPGIKPLDSHIPYELLILGDLKPEKVSGFGSSLFFNQNKGEILSYIQRTNHDPYLTTLKKAKLVTDKNLYSFEKTKKWIHENSLFVNYDEPYANYWLIKVGENRFCKMTINQCATLTNDSSSFKILHFDNGYILKLQHIKENEWKEIKN